MGHSGVNRSRCWQHKKLHLPTKEMTTKKTLILEGERKEQRSIRQEKSPQLLQHEWKFWVFPLLFNWIRSWSHRAEESCSRQSCSFTSNKAFFRCRKNMQDRHGEFGHPVSRLLSNWRRRRLKSISMLFFRGQRIPAGLRLRTIWLIA